jgi:hypothetical protein
MASRFADSGGWTLVDRNHDIVYAPCMGMNLKQIKFDEQDLKAVETVRQMYGCDSFSQAVRLAARIVASGRRMAYPLPPSPKYSNAKRALESVEGLIQLSDSIDPDRLDAALDEAAERNRFAWLDPAPVPPIRRRAAAHNAPPSGK